MIIKKIAHIWYTISLWAELFKKDSINVKTLSVSVTRTHTHTLRCIDLVPCTTYLQHLIPVVGLNREEIN